MNTAELIYQETKDLPEAQAREILDFVKFLKTKRQRAADDAAHQRPPLKPSPDEMKDWLRQEVWHLPVIDPRHPDDILGYNTHGLCD